MLVSSGQKPLCESAQHYVGQRGKITHQELADTCYTDT